MQDKVVNQLISQWIGKHVYVEGTFPIPQRDGQVAYAPAHGTLVEVYEDGISIMEPRSEHPTVYFRSNLRSISCVPESDLTSSRKGGIISPH